MSAATERRQREVEVRERSQRVGVVVGQLAAGMPEARARRSPAPSTTTVSSVGGTACVTPCGRRAASGRRHERSRATPARRPPSARYCHHGRLRDEDAAAASTYSRIGPGRYHEAERPPPAASGAQNVQRSALTRDEAERHAGDHRGQRDHARRTAERAAVRAARPATGAKNGSSSTCARAFASSAANSSACITMSAFG